MKPDGNPESMHSGPTLPQSWQVLGPRLVMGCSQPSEVSHLEPGWALGGSRARLGCLGFLSLLPPPFLSPPPLAPPPWCLLFLLPFLLFLALRQHRSAPVSVRASSLDVLKALGDPTPGPQSLL